MPSKVTWLVENRVLLVNFTGVVTQEEFKAFVAQIHSHIREAAYLTVHQIIDARQLHTLPDNHILLCFDSVRQEGIGWTMIISNNNIPLRTRVTTINRHMNILYRYVATMDEATQFLKKMDTSLPDSYITPL